MIEAMDTVAESCILPFGKIKDLDLEVKKYTLDELKATIEETASLIQEKCSENITEGAKNTLSGIAEQLNIKGYLIKNNL